MKKNRLLGGFFDQSIKVILLCFLFSGILIIFGSFEASADDPLGSFEFQQQPISGVVSDENGAPMPGVNVQLQGTTIGTITDINGRYSLNVSNTSEAVLIFSFVGYDQQVVPASGRSSINVSMKSATSALDEVIVVGYGTTRKADLTGSVSAVSDEQYKTQPVTRVDEILQGRIAGVNVTAISGAPGGTTSIRIRGSNSITGSNEPLYVIDGFVGADMSTVNPTDIESIQILKDASSTAIYGSRGSNGVVLIQTKRGSSRDSKFTISSRYYLSNPIGKWPVMNAYDFVTVANERALALGGPSAVPKYSDEEVEYWKTHKGTDWQDEVFRTAGGQEFQLDYSGGSDRITYFVSGNYLKQDGIIINSDFKRYSLRTNVNAKLSDKFNASLKVNFNRRESNNISGGFSTLGVVGLATAWAPTTPVYDELGNFTAQDPISSIKTNPVESAMNDGISEINSFSTNGNFVYTFFKGLTFDVGFGVNYTNTQGKNFSLGAMTKQPSASRSSRDALFLQSTNNLTYTKIFNNVHNLTITGVAEYQWNASDYFTVSSQELLFPLLRYNALSLAKTYTTSNSYTKSTIGSYIGRINYSYLDRYLVTISGRNDRSSKFRGKNQRSFFPSIGLGWRISEENFMANLDFISNLKLRASWGDTGSQAIDVYGTVTSYDTGARQAGYSFAPNTISSGIRIGSPGNPDLKWETTAQTNVGIDLGLFKERITLEADWFYKYTTDLLINEPVPGYVGGGSIYNNVGAMSNRGFEFNLSARVIERNDFSWRSNFNISFLTNQVEDLGDRDYLLMRGGAGAGQVQSPEMILKPGHSISSYWGVKSLGIWQEDEAELAALYKRSPGDYKFEDLNPNDPQNPYTIDAADYQIIGSGLPKKMIGFNNTISYKRFTLNAFMQAMLDYDKWNFAYAQIMIAAADAREILHVDVMDRWSPTNTDSKIAAFNPTNVGLVQASNWMESGNYLRLKNISLTYTLPKSVLRWGELTATISGQNMWTLTNYKGIDPETYSNTGSGDVKGGDGGAYPNAKTWTFGLSLTF